MSVWTTILAGLALAAIGTSAPEPEITDERRDEAASSFAQGEAAFAGREFDDAVVHFSRANELMPHPNTLYNLGVAQELAGNAPAAWATFRTLERTTDSGEARDDARDRLGRLERRLAVLRVLAVPRSRLCLDSKPVMRGAGGAFEVAAREGDYEVVMDDTVMPIRLTKGETHVLRFDPDQTQRPPPSRRTRPLLFLAVGAGASATGLGIASIAVRNDDQRLGLGAGAAAAAATATGAALAALIHTRRRARQAASAAVPTNDSCPPHPDLVPGPS